MEKAEATIALIGRCNVLHFESRSGDLYIPSLWGDSGWRFHLRDAAAVHSWLSFSKRAIVAGGEIIAYAFGRADLAREQGKKEFAGLQPDTLQFQLKVIRKDCFLR